MVGNNHNEVRMMPLSDDTQTCTDFWLTTNPLAHIFFFNLPSGRVHHFNIRAPHRDLMVTTTASVETKSFDPYSSIPVLLDDWDYFDADQVRESYAEYLMPTERVPLGPEVDRLSLAAQKYAEGPSAGSFLIALNRVLHRVIEYVPGSTHVDSTISEVLTSHRGVCQDFTHIMLAVCRRRGIPARYVSGYLYTGVGHQGDDHLKNGAAKTLVDLGLAETEAAVKEHAAESALVDGGAMHAWVECLLPDGAWHGFDPTNNILTTEAYVRVHTGRDYADVPPLRGVYAGPRAMMMDVAVKVTQD